MPILDLSLNVAAVCGRGHWTADTRLVVAVAGLEMPRRVSRLDGESRATPTKARWRQRPHRPATTAPTRSQCRCHPNRAHMDHCRSLSRDLTSVRLDLTRSRDPEQQADKGYSPVRTFRAATPATVSATATAATPPW